MHLAILGFGLIGGSVARALHGRARDAWSVSAWSPSGVGPDRAAAEGVIARAARDAGEAVDGADLVLLAAPPLDCLALLDELAGPLRLRLGAGATVTDVASTKRRLVAHAGTLGLPFVGGHPMAGVETTGYAAADAELFVGRPWVVCAAADASDAWTAPVERLARAVGAVPVRVDPDAHDAAVAGISHLPLVVSAALAEAVLGSAARDPETARDLAAGGWRGMTRLARGDVTMAAGIAATNAGPLRDRLRALRTVLDDWLAALDDDEPDADALARRFAAARDLLDDPAR